MGAFLSVGFSFQALANKFAANTVFFFKLDKGDSLLDGKMSKIITFVEITPLNVKILMVYWSRL